MGTSCSCFTHNIHFVLFSTSGVIVMSFSLHSTKHLGAAYPFQEIFLQDFWWLKLRGNLGGSLDKNDDVGEALIKSFKYSFDIILMKTFKEIEAKYMNYLSILTKKKTEHEGPLVKEPKCEEDQKMKSLNGSTRRISIQFYLLHLVVNIF